MLFELLFYFVGLFALTVGFLWLESRVSVSSSERRFEALESALGRGVRFTVSAGVGGAHPYRVEHDGVVYGVTSVDEVSWLIHDMSAGASAGDLSYAVPLSHPSGRSRS